MLSRACWPCLDRRAREYSAARPRPRSDCPTKRARDADGRVQARRRLGDDRRSPIAVAAPARATRPPTWPPSSRWTATSARGRTSTRSAAWPTRCSRARRRTASPAPPIAAPAAAHQRPVLRVPDVDPRSRTGSSRCWPRTPPSARSSAGEAWSELEAILIALLGPSWRRDAALPPHPPASRPAPAAAAHRSAVVAPERPAPPRHPADAPRRPRRPGARRRLHAPPPPRAPPLPPPAPARRPPTRPRRARGRARGRVDPVRRVRRWRGRDRDRRRGARRRRPLARAGHGRPRRARGRLEQRARPSATTSRTSARATAATLRSAGMARVLNWLERRERTLAPALDGPRRVGRHEAAVVGLRRSGQAVAPGRRPARRPRAARRAGRGACVSPAAPTAAPRGDPQPASARERALALAEQANAAAARSTASRPRATSSRPARRHSSASLSRTVFGRMSNESAQTSA